MPRDKLLSENTLPVAFSRTGTIILTTPVVIFAYQIKCIQTCRKHAATIHRHGVIFVKYHASREHASFDDIIRGKGKGLIGLLGGSPGCGKTLTAEAVAEVTHKPLYVVSAGELGTTPEHVEARLLRALQLAQTWDAVLLLDEADVFLQQRSTLDITRNSLVAIFLRQLEYYKGIMILTTNMVQNCDGAFESTCYAPCEKD